MTPQDFIDLGYENLMVIDGFDDCVIGITANDDRLVYSYCRMVEVLMDRDKMTEDDAKEYLDVNVVYCYMGELSPIVIFDYPEAEEKKANGM